MKFNWGHGIALSLILFIGFIAYLVRGTFQERIDLTSEDYYQREVDFDQERHALIAGEQLGEVAVLVEDEKVRMTLPATNWDELNIQFFRAENAELDFEIPLSEVVDGIVEFNRPLKGQWNIEIVGVMNGEQYRWKFTQYI